MATFPAVLVTGARQVGKTTLLRSALGATHDYASLDRPEMRDRAERDAARFIGDVHRPLVIDEVQYVPKILEWIKSSVDADRRPGRFVLSGSRSFPLMKGVAETLAGRIAVLTLDPLDASETEGRARTDTIDDRLAALFDEDVALEENRLSPVLDAFEWILRGGYPEIRLNPSVDRQLWFSSYIATYVDRDVRDLMQIGDLSTFHRFVALAATRTGQILSLSDLAADLGISVPTVKRWLSVLETSQSI